MRDLLAALDAAHSGLIAFERSIHSAAVIRLLQPSADAGLLYPPDAKLGWVAFADSIVQEDERLVVATVELASPGIWAFLGGLNPLQTIREYLDDRHRHRLEDSREPEELRSKRIQNDAGEIKVLRDKLRLAKELGAPEEITALLLRRLVGQPLEAIGEMQDRGLINGSEASVERLRASSKRT
jgi:hypothetical protein